MTSEIASAAGIQSQDLELLIIFRSRRILEMSTHQRRANALQEIEPVADSVPDLSSAKRGIRELSCPDTAQHIAQRVASGTPTQLALIRQFTVVHRRAAWHSTRD